MRDAVGGWKVGVGCPDAPAEDPVPTRRHENRAVLPEQRRARSTAGDRPPEDHQRSVYGKLTNLLGLLALVAAHREVALFELGAQLLRCAVNARGVSGRPLRQGGVTGPVHPDQSGHALLLVWPRIWARP